MNETNEWLNYVVYKLLLPDLQSVNILYLYVPNITWGVEIKSNFIDFVID